MTGWLRSAALPGLVWCTGFHLAQSMQFPVLGQASALLAAVLWLVPLRPAAPTIGLAFIVLVSGGMGGYFFLEELAVPGSWPALFRVFAGICCGGWALLLWFLWAHEPASRSDQPGPTRAVDPVAQQLVIGALLLLLLTPQARDPLAVTHALGGGNLPGVSHWLSFQTAGVLLAALALTLERVTWPRRRLLWLLPVVLLAPGSWWVLKGAQRPMVGVLFAMAPNLRAPNVGFSPYQRLDASAFLRPSSRVVMRVFGDFLPGQLLVGNRLEFLSGRTMTWRAESPLGKALDVGVDDHQRRIFLVANHLADRPAWAASGLEIRSLRWDELVFLPPEGGRVALPASQLTQSRHRVWEAKFDPAASKGWQVSATPAQPAARDGELLKLPEFWDAELQRKALSYGGPPGEPPQRVVSRIKADFLGREYRLGVQLDTRRPMADFLINERPGYCFWYASAAALVLRANGIPSRLVSGYLVHERLGRETWLVRQRDAHSWVEWQDARGYWHTFDPTPPAILDFYQGYDGSALSRGWQRLVIWLDRALERLVFSDRVENALIVGGFLVLLWLFIREYRRIDQARRALPGSARQWRLLWRRFLAASGLPEQPHWSAARYAACLPDAWSPRKRRLAENFLRIYGAGRFASRGLSAHRYRRLVRLLKMLRRAR